MTRHIPHLRLRVVLAFVCAFAPMIMEIPAAPDSERLWLPPLGSPLSFSAPFSLPHGTYQAGHRGIDLPASPGTVVRSPTNGTISFVGLVVDREVLSIRLASGAVISLEPITSELRGGDPVVRGQVLGTVSQGGHCATSCLHLGVREQSQYVNPLRFFRPKPVLLPWS